jgi:hypothetical protein
LRNEVVIGWINLQAQNCTNNFHLSTTNVTLWVNNGQMEFLTAFCDWKVFFSNAASSHICQGRVFFGQHPFWEQKLPWHFKRQLCIHIQLERS